MMMKNQPLFGSKTRALLTTAVKMMRTRVVARLLNKTLTIWNLHVALEPMHVWGCLICSIGGAEGGRELC